MNWKLLFQLFATNLLHKPLHAIAMQFKVILNIFFMKCDCKDRFLDVKIRQHNDSVIQPQLEIKAFHHNATSVQQFIYHDKL